MPEVSVVQGAPSNNTAAANHGFALAKALSGRVGLLVLESMTGMLCARVLKPEGRGELSAMILWPVFLCQIFTLGIPSATIYTIRRKAENVGATIAGALTLSSVTGMVATIFGFIVLPFWLKHYSSTVVEHSKWFMVFAPVSMAVMILRGILEAYGQFGRSAVSLVMTRMLTLCALIGLVSLHSLTSITAAYAYLLTGFPALIWMLILVAPKARWSLKPMQVALRAMLTYGLRSYGIDLCGALSQYIDQALVLGMLSAAQMGTYTVALSLSRILNVIAVAASTVLFPRTVGASPRNAVLTAIRTQIAVLAMTSVGATAMMVLGQTALRLLYGGEYANAASQLRILIIEAVLSGSLSIMSQPFMALGKPGVVTTLQITGLLTSIPFIIVLAPRFGTEGACVALVLSACVRVVLLGVCYAKILPGVVDWRADVRTEFGNVFRSARGRVALRFRPAEA